MSKAEQHTQDVRAMSRALQERWPIGQQQRATIIKRMMAIVDSKNATRRERTAAARALISADALNLQEEAEPRGMDLQLNVNVDARAASATVIERIDMSRLTDEQLLRLVENGGMLPGGEPGELDAGAVPGGSTVARGPGGAGAREAEPASVPADGVAAG